MADERRPPIHLIAWLAELLAELGPEELETLKLKLTWMARHPETLPSQRESDSDDHK